MNDIILIALPEEAPSLAKLPNVFLTGVGKVNAAITAARLLERLRPKRVFNFGTAGGITVHSGLHKCTTFTQRDYQNPFGAPIVIKTADNGLFLTMGSGTGLTLSTGDNFVTDPTTITADLVDMEGYAIAAAAEKYNTEFHCYKYISDSADETASEKIQKNIHKGEPFYMDILKQYGVNV